MGLIKISNRENVFAIVDDEDMALLSGLNWLCDHKGYVVCSRNPTHSRIHRTIMGLAKFDKIQVDHINRNKLDNRKENLRLCTNSENQRNKERSSNKKLSSKGVFTQSGITFYALITINGKRIHLGNFSNEAEAALAYDKAAITYHGEFALLNNPKSNVEKSPRPKPITVPTKTQWLHGKRRHNTSGFKGVSFRKKFGNYQAYIGLNGKIVYVGVFETAIEAALARDKKAIELRGKEVDLNFPEMEAS
jgi:hypothetical protein